MDWFNNSLSRTKEQEQKRKEEFKAEMAKNKPAVIEEVKQEEPQEPPQQEEPAKNPVIEEEEPQQEEPQPQPKKLYKTIDPATLSEEEKEYRQRAGVPLDFDLSDADDGWEEDFKNHPQWDD
jgi:hypothetical protein